MPRARLAIDIPESVWIGSVSREHPGATFRVLAAMPEGDRGVGLVEVRAPDIGAVAASIDEQSAVTDVAVLHRHENRATLQFETSDPLLLFPVQSAGVPLELPFDIREGTATWELTASHDRLSQLGDQLDAFDIRFTVESVEHYVDPDRLLTDRQRRLLVEAVDRGYYDTPRGCSLTELAEALDVAKSSVSETLHRAEGAVVKHYIADLGEDWAEAVGGSADG
ncbi:MAG: helix-turn-helix domain-containing protein [Halobacteriales archaeon]|nr:helix-turn-helix domain-containing protein [Halobacteriales archaeon]